MTKLPAVAAKYRGLATSGRAEVFTCPSGDRWYTVLFRNHVCEDSWARFVVGLWRRRPLPGPQRKQAKEQVEFGIQVAQRGLWKEAIYRWERATQLDPTYAAAFNNLAVAYEHEGQLAKAREAYEKALALEPKNALVRQNYDLFKEINDRAAQKDGR